MDTYALPDFRHYRMPAEWAPHAGTILTWPHRPAIWRGVHAEVEQTFAQLAAALSEVEQVYVNVPDAEWRGRAQVAVAAAGGNLTNISFYLINSNDVWARDHGPIFIVRRPRAPDHLPPRAMLDWKFNAWGGKFDADLDDCIPRLMNDQFKVPRVEPGLVMEGGSLDVNGAGDLLTTEAVLMNINRNPDHNRTDIEDCLKLTLGVERLHWLGAGLHGDDTDGHIDDVARFVGERRVVLVQPRPGHPDHAAMAENRRRLDAAGLEVVPLPAPEPMTFAGDALPASYANFYICNGKVLMPTFAQATDAEAANVLAACFPDRRVVGIDARALVSQSGSLHCVTQQVPAP
jgi:agmatine deiminase